MTGHDLLFLVLIVVSVGVAVRSDSQLSPDYYQYTCPKALLIVKQEVEAAIKAGIANGPPLVRLHFHDCFVNGCDASLLLDDNATFVGEKTANANFKSVRGFHIIDKIKAKLEEACPGVVSCADILAIVAKDAVAYLGGPSWEVKLGRRDSTNASRDAANAMIPPPTLNLSALISSFSSHGLSIKDLVALSGAHTVGVARCTSFRDRIYNDTDIDSSFANSLKLTCPSCGNDDALASLDLQTPTCFDNLYYQNLLKKKGLLHSDQELYNGNSSTDSLVQTYSTNTFEFFKDFSSAMIKMGDIDPLTGSEGEIRTNCRKAN